MCGAPGAAICDADSIISMILAPIFYFPPFSEFVSLGLFTGLRELRRAPGAAQLHCVREFVDEEPDAGPDSNAEDGSLRTAQ